MFKYLNSTRKRTKLSSNVPSVYSHGHPIMAAASIISNQTAQATSHLFHSTPLTLHIRSASLTHLCHEFLSFIFLVQDKRHLVEIKRYFQKRCLVEMLEVLPASSLTSLLSSRLVPIFRKKSYILYIVLYIYKYMYFED